MTWYVSKRLAWTIMMQNGLGMHEGNVFNTLHPSFNSRVWPSCLFN